jgi:hypothetical protein
MRRGRQRYISINENGGKPRRPVDPFPRRNEPVNTPEQTERVERLVDRVLKEHGETIDKLADE